MKYRSLILVLLFFLAFLLLLVNHLVDFNIKYFKYASSYLINKWNLQYGYFFMIMVESLTLLLLIKRFRKKWFLLFYEGLLAIYILFLVVCLSCIYEITDGCVDCHYFARLLFDDYRVTLGTVIGLGILYLVFIREYLRGPGMKQSNGKTILHRKGSYTEISSQS